VRLCRCCRFKGSPIAARIPAYTVLPKRPQTLAPAAAPRPHPAHTRQLCQASVQRRHRDASREGIQPVEVRPVGNTVDISRATYQNTIGDVELKLYGPIRNSIRAWMLSTTRASSRSRRRAGPRFKPIKLGIAPPDIVQATVQETSLYLADLGTHQRPAYANRRAGSDRGRSEAEGLSGAR
jgi:hypothetical protein